MATPPAHAFTPKRSLLLILVTACLLRAALLAGAMLHPDASWMPDSRDYDMLARELLRTASFSRNGTPEIYRVPGYPFLLAGVYSLFGHSALAAITVQLLLDTALCVLVWRLAPLWFASTDAKVADSAGRAGRASSRCNPMSVALFAGLWQAGSLVSAVYAARILSDAPFAFLLTGALFLFAVLASPPGAESRTTPFIPPPLPFRRARLSVPAFTFGLFLGCLVLVRVITLPFSVLALFVLWRLRGPRGAAFAVLGMVLVVGSWTIRNRFETGYTGVSTVGALYLYRYEAAALVASRRGCTFLEVQQEFDRKLAAFPRQAEAAGFAQKTAVRILARHPIHAAWIHLYMDAAVLFPAAGEFLRMFGIRIGGNGTLSVLHSRGLPAALRHYCRGSVAAAVFILVWGTVVSVKYGLAAFGLFWRMRRGPRWLDVLALGAIVYFVLTPGPAAHPRFRIPVEPLISLYAGLGACLLPKNRAGRARGAA